MSAASDFALYGYFRSSAAFRVRIALNLKGIKPELRFIHLLKDGGEQHAADYKGLNPQSWCRRWCMTAMPIAQSLAIIEYLDEIVPEPPLLPKDALGRARVREIAYAIACDIHPINNLRVLRYLQGHIERRRPARRMAAPLDRARASPRWRRMLAAIAETGTFCHGDTPTLADICLIPQMANARRVKLDLTPYPDSAAHRRRVPIALPASPPRCPRTSPMPNKTRARPRRFLPYRLSVLSNRVSERDRAAIFRPLRPLDSGMARDGGAGPGARPVGARRGRAHRDGQGAGQPRRRACWRPSAWRAPPTRRTAASRVCRSPPKAAPSTTRSCRWRSVWRNNFFPDLLPWSRNPSTRCWQNYRITWIKWRRPGPPISISGLSQPRRTEPPDAPEQKDGAKRDDRPKRISRRGDTAGRRPGDGDQRLGHGGDARRGVAAAELAAARLAAKPELDGDGRIPPRKSPQPPSGPEGRNQHQRRHKREEDNGDTLHHRFHLCAQQARG